MEFREERLEGLAAQITIECHSWPEHRLHLPHFKEEAVCDRQAGSVLIYVHRDRTNLQHRERVSRSELRSCVKVEVAVLGSPSLIVRAVSVDVKQH